MIVYNVERRWFAHKNAAETYRRSQGLKPSATTKVTVTHREQLAFILDQLCSTEPAPAGNGMQIEEFLGDHEPPMVSPDVDVPKFLRDEWAKFRKENPKL